MGGGNHDHFISPSSWLYTNGKSGITPSFLVLLVNSGNIHGENREHLGKGCGEDFLLNILTVIFGHIQMVLCSRQVAIYVWSLRESMMFKIPIWESSAFKC